MHCQDGSPIARLVSLRAVNNLLATSNRANGPTRKCLVREAEVGIMSGVFLQTKMLLSPSMELGIRSGSKRTGLRLRNGHGSQLDQTRVT